MIDFYSPCSQHSQDPREVTTINKLYECVVPSSHFDLRGSYEFMTFETSYY